MKGGRTYPQFNADQYLKSNTTDQNKIAYGGQWGNNTSLVNLVDDVDKLLIFVKSSVNMHHLSGLFREAKQCSIYVTEVRSICGIDITISLTSWRRPMKALELVGCLNHEKQCREQGNNWWGLTVLFSGMICQCSQWKFDMVSLYIDTIAVSQFETDGERLFQVGSYCFYIDTRHLCTRLCCLMWLNDLEQEHCLRRKHQHSRQTVFIWAWLCASVVWQLTLLLLFKNCHSIMLGIHNSNYFTKESINYTIWIVNH